MVSKANTVLRRTVGSMRFFFIVGSFLNSLAGNLRLFALQVQQSERLLLVYLVEGGSTSVDEHDLMTYLWEAMKGQFRGLLCKMT